MPKLSQSLPSSGTASSKATFVASRPTSESTGERSTFVNAIFDARSSFGSSALSWISPHLSHPLHPLKPIFSQVKHDSVDALEAVVTVQTPALFGRLEIAVETRLLLLLESPLDQETPRPFSPVLLCCHKECKHYIMLIESAAFGVQGLGMEISLDVRRCGCLPISPLRVQKYSCAASLRAPY